MEEKRVAELVNIDAENDHTTHHLHQEEENPAEIKDKVQFLRALVEKQVPSSKGMDDSTIRRFLRARDLDTKRAASMLLKYVTWRQTFVPNGLISVSQVPNEIEQNKIFAQGVDKQGRPLAVIFGARHFVNKKGGLDEFKRFVVYSLDKLSSSMPPGLEKFVVIIDLQGWGYANSDIRGYLGGLSILQDYYPERLAKVFMIHVPYIFTTVWKIIYPFIDDNTKKKFIFVEKKKIKAALLEDIDESQLPEMYGGKLALVPIQDT